MNQLYARIEAFALFGLAESDALSSALLIYVTSWLEVHYPYGRFDPSASSADTSWAGRFILLGLLAIRPGASSALPGVWTGRLSSCYTRLVAVAGVARRRRVLPGR